MKLNDDDWRLIEDALRDYKLPMAGNFRVDRDRCDRMARARELAERIRTRDAR